MDHARSKNFVFLFLSLVCLTACSSRTPEEYLVKHLEEKYANLYVNNENSKREAITELQEFFKTHKLNDDSIEDVKKIVHKINDGHVVIFDDRKEKNAKFVSGLNFIPGTGLISSCENCEPALSKDTYEILQVNNQDLNSYLDSHKFTVAASTSWGREYRLIRLLKENTNSKETILKVKSSKGKYLSTKLTWAVSVSGMPECVRGERVDEKTFRLSIFNLWCEDTSRNGETRTQVYENFKTQFNKALSAANDTDNIILDLRENGGGGDNEVEYVLNAFFAKSVFMYHYRYLRKTHPGKMKHFEKYMPFKFSLWSKDEYQYTDISHKPEKQFFNNKLIVLTTAGCFSSCETIASTIKLEKRAKVLGTKTHGGSGDPVIFAIKGTSYSINLPTCVTWQENGEYFEGLGVIPDVEFIQRPDSTNDDLLKAAIDQVL